MEIDVTQYILLIYTTTVIARLLSKEMQKNPKAHKITSHILSGNDTEDLQNQCKHEISI